MDPAGGADAEQLVRGVGRVGERAEEVEQGPHAELPPQRRQRHSAATIAGQGEIGGDLAFGNHGRLLALRCIVTMHLVAFAQR
mgnify:CR=1 FL=1